MSDFISRFDPNKYGENEKKNKKDFVNIAEDEVLDNEKELKIEKPEIKRSRSEPEVEIDTSYHKKQKRKKIMIISGVIVAICLLFVGYHYISTVKVDNFVGKDVSELRKWAGENGLGLDLTQEYSDKVATNEVISQGVNSGKRIAKSKKLQATVSKGADPEEHLELPDFNSLSQADAEKWVSDNKADNVSISTEYSDKVEKGKYIRQKFENSDVNADNYLRRNSLIVYYSKGKEVFEKNIEVTDFVGKEESVVNDWGKSKDVKIEKEEATSDKVEVGKVISQSVAAGEKVAKQDTLKIVISVGKGVEVPNFNDYSMEDAANFDGLQVKVKQVYSTDYVYGTCLYQSIEAGTELTDKDNKQMNVTYSLGQPYLKSYYGQLEGDLDKLFYDDYRSKGANINYTKYYVDSSQAKGTVVEMSNYNTYVGLDYTVSIGISNGSGYNPNAAPVNVPTADNNDLAKDEAQPSAENNTNKNNN